MIARGTSKNTIEELLNFLSPEPVPEGYSEAEIVTMKAFGVKPPTRTT